MFNRIKRTIETSKFKSKHDSKIFYSEYLNMFIRIIYVIDWDNWFFEVYEKHEEHGMIPFQGRDRIRHSDNDVRDFIKFAPQWGKDFE